MNLYKGGYGKYEFYTVAKDEEEAKRNIQDKPGMRALPVTAEQIDDIDGYDIRAVKKREEPKKK